MDTPEPPSSGPPPPPAPPTLPTVAGLPHHATPPRRAHGPRLYHKKSRFGCKRCKARRVKCDEQRPACTGCSRHMVECVYPFAVDLGVNHTPETASTIVNRKRPRVEGPHGGHGDSRGVVGGSVGPGVSRASRGELAYSPESPGDHGATTATPGKSYGGDDDDPSDAFLRIPETRTRRLTELRLVHHYLLNQSMTFGRPLVPPERMESRQSTAAAAATSTRHSTAAPSLSNSVSASMSPASTATTPSSHANGATTAGKRFRDTNRGFVWSVDVLSMAFKNDCILYTVLAHAALSIWVGADAGWVEDDDDEGDGGEDDENGDNGAGLDRDARRKDKHRQLQQQYLAMALRAQRRAVDNLSHDTADGICIASLMLLNHSFALVQTLPVQPWQPPNEWLQMGRGAFQVLLAARAYLSEDRYAAEDSGIGANTTVASLSGLPEGGDGIEVEPAPAPAAKAAATTTTTTTRSDSATASSTEDGYDIHHRSFNCQTHQHLCHILHTDRHHSHIRQSAQSGNEQSGRGTSSQTEGREQNGATKPPNGSAPRNGAASQSADTAASTSGPTASPPAPAAPKAKRRSRTTNRFIHTPPRFDPDEIFDPANAEPYLWLLDDPPGSVAAFTTVNKDAGPPSGPASSGPSPDTPADMVIYRRVLCYIGWCAAALPDDPINALCRRFAGAAYFFPSEMQVWLDERRPRALVLLAHFFALWIPLQHIWMIGPTGPQQVRAIYGELPAAWRPRVAPLLEEHGLVV